MTTNYYTKSDLKNKFKIGVTTESNIANVTLTSNLLDLTDTNLYFNFDLKTGPQGPQGPAGSNGSDGNDGTTSPRGPKGDSRSSGDAMGIISLIGNVFLV